MSELQKQIDELRTQAMPLYREVWQGAHSFKELPILTREQLAATPLSKRRYTEGPSFMKVVAGDTPFLSEWLLSDLAREPFGAITRRPLVYFSSAHETVEKGMWCHLNKMTRFLGETNSEVTLRAAEKFSVDSLIVDAASLSHMSPILPTLRHLYEISLLGSSFSLDEIRGHAGDKSVRLVLTLPETGVIADSDLALYPRFSAREDCLLEEVNGEIILTRKTKLMTPIVRYATGIQGHLDDSFVILT